MKQKLETFQLQKIERKYGYGINDYERGVRQLEAWRGDRELHEARRHARMVRETLAWAEDTATERRKHAERKGEISNYEILKWAEKTALARRAKYIRRYGNEG